MFSLAARPGTQEPAARRGTLAGHRGRPGGLAGRAIPARTAGTTASPIACSRPRAWPPTAAWLRAYLRLDVDLDAIYADWRTRDPYLGELTTRLAGLRLVDQEAEECLLSFTCSKANAIPRIQRAIGELSRDVGHVPSPGGARPPTIAFPPPRVLAALDADSRWPSAPAWNGAPPA